jgi:hypothetical protein
MSEQRPSMTEDDFVAIMALVEEYGYMREWHGARPGDDTTGQLDAAEAAVRVALRRLVIVEKEQA